MKFKPNISHSPFGADRFGRYAEAFARFFGTPAFIITQTVIVIIWITANAWILVNGFDEYPFILLNLCFSTQAAYAAPLILLAQTRQAERDKATMEFDAKHREEIAEQHQTLLKENTAITESIFKLTQEVNALVQKIEERPGQE